MTMRELLQLVIQECHLHPERVDWPLAVRIVEYGGFQEHTVLTSIVADKTHQAYWVTAAPHSTL